MKDCCKFWARAQCAGSDNEGYGCLLYNHNNNFRKDAPPEWSMGCVGGGIVKFCPWCGDKKSE